MNTQLSAKPLQATKQDVQTVQQALQKHKQGMTPADLIVRTGLSVYQVNDALAELIKKHPCRLDVNEKGELIYEFDFQTEKNTLAKWAGKVWNSTKKGIVNFVKWRVSNDLYKNYSGGIINWVIALAPLSPLIPFYFLFRQFSPSFKAKTDDIIQFFCEGEPSPYHNAFRKDEIRKIAFNFILGEKEVKDELDLEKRILSYIDLNNRKITTADLVMLTGWSFEKAEQEATKLMVQYHGNVYVTEEGVIIYHFPEIDSQNKVWYNTHSNTSPYIWDNLIPLRKWNTNYASENTTMAKAITIQFLYALFFLPLWFFLSRNSSFMFDTMFSLLYYGFWITVSLAYSSFLPTFIIGKTKMLRENNKRKQENEYFSFLQKIFSTQKLLLILDENLPNNEKEKLYDRVLHEWQAEIKHDEQGNIVYHFERLEKELEVVQRERNRELSE
jgi:hypothetical protein